MMGGSLTVLTAEYEAYAWRHPILIATVCASVALDVGTNVLNFIGAPSTAIPLAKGVLTLIVLASLRRIISYVAVSAFLLLFLTRWLLILFEGQDLFLFDDAVFFFRILFFVVWLLLFDELRGEKALLKAVCSVFVAISSLSFLSGILGMLLDLDFFRAYEGQRAGFKGLFYGENDTSVMYTIALLYAWISFKKKHHRWYLVLTLSGLGILGMGSKTAFAAIPLVPLLYWYYSGAPSRGGDMRMVWQKIKTVTVCAGALILMGVLWAILDLGVLAGSYVYPQFFTLMQEFGIVSALLSGRDLKVFAYLDSVASIPDILFGVQIQRYLGSPVDGSFMVEVDIFDYLARVGVFGVLLVMFLIYRASRGDQPRLSREGKVLLTIVVILGATVGHTLLSGLNSMWIAFFIVFYSRFESDRNSGKALPR